MYKPSSLSQFVFGSKNTNSGGSHTKQPSFSRGHIRNRSITNFVVNNVYFPKTEALSLAMFMISPIPVTSIAVYLLGTHYSYGSSIPTLQHVRTGATATIVFLILSIVFRFSTDIAYPYISSQQNAKPQSSSDRLKQHTGNSMVSGFTSPAPATPTTPSATAFGSGSYTGFRAANKMTSLKSVISTSVVNFIPITGTAAFGIYWLSQRLLLLEKFHSGTSNQDDASSPTLTMTKRF